jgi:hypothetical protein
MGASCRECVGMYIMEFRLTMGWKSYTIRIYNQRKVDSLSACVDDSSSRSVHQGTESAISPQRYKKSFGGM